MYKRGQPLWRFQYESQALRHNKGRLCIYKKSRQNKLNGLYSSGLAFTGSGKFVSHVILLSPLRQSYTSSEHAEAQLSVLVNSVANHSPDRNRLTVHINSPLQASIVFSSLYHKPNLINEGAHSTPLHVFCPLHRGRKLSHRSAKYTDPDN
jgi:hypothetical protein